MDIYCHRCGEPWDMDSLHEVWDESTNAPMAYSTAAELFRRFGCGAMEGRMSTTCALDPTSPTALMAQVAMEISGHPDDWASDCDDLRFMEGL